VSDRPRPHPCFGCGDLATLHFSLQIMKEHPSRARIAAGPIDLCHLCWRQATAAAAIRKRPRRPVFRQASAY
jgi:hypothetical protein